MSSASIERQAKLKALNSQLAEAKGQHMAAMAAQVAAQKRTAEAERLVNGLVKQISKLEEEQKVETAGEPAVSEHAILRWLERHHGLNIDGVRDEILADGTAAAIKFAGTGKIVKNGLTLVVKDNTVITVAPMNKGAITL